MQAWIFLTLCVIPPPSDGLRAELQALLGGKAAAPDSAGIERFVPLTEVFPESTHERVKSDDVEALFALATRAAKEEPPRMGVADACLRAILERDPDHAEARRLLGYVRYKKGWATPFAAEQLKSGKVLDDTYGWVSASWVDHLDRGELPGTTFRGEQPTKWLPAAEADALRSDFNQRPWVITTEHFEIRTNVPLSEAIGFGRKLENLHQLFYALLADVIGPQRLPLAQRFENTKLEAKAVGRRMKVWYFSDRQLYIDYFKRKFSRDESQSLGYYMPPDEARGYGVESRSYFYRDTDNPIDATSTLFHEGSHQILFESAGPTQYQRNRGHFWVWEGLGTYFETVRFHPDGSLSIGGVVGARMQQARALLVEREKLVPIDQLINLGRDDFLKEPDVYVNYPEAMALVAYLMNGRAGALRDGFFQYVREAYDGQLQVPDRLEELVGVSVVELQRGLLDYLRGGKGP